MISLKWRHSRRVRSTRFVPTSFGGFDAARLEARALTAPAFWRQPGSFNGDPGSSLDGVWAQSIGAFSSPTDNINGFGDNYASASSVSTNTSASGATTLTMSGLSTAGADDLDQTYPPLDPVGTYTVSLNTTNSITAVSSGAGEPVFNWFVSSSFTNRSYSLADDSTTPGPATILEHAYISYSPGAASVTNMFAFVGSPGLAITANGDNTGITAANINGVNLLIPSSGSFTDGAGDVFTYAASASGVDAHSVISLGTLPTVSRDGLGNIVGIGWTVSTNTSLTAPIGLYVDNGISTLTTHYDAHFA